MNYLYDHSFEGFLTCVYHHWYTEKAAGIYPDGEYQLDLCNFAMTIKTEPDKADRVLRAIETKLSKWDAQRVYQAFCSGEPEKEMKLLCYIALGFERGSKIRLLHGDPIVKAVEEIERRVGLEAHRMTGLVRFSEIRNLSVDSAGSSGEDLLLYSKIEPDNDILEFIAPHFVDRFKSNPFVIHDLKRGKALFAFARKWDIAPLASDAPIIKTEREHESAALWKQYFEVMATRERINPRCQRNFLPTRYRKHLPEFT